MGILISTKNKDRLFENKDIINIGANSNCDFVLDFDEGIFLTIQVEKNKLTVLNNFGSNKILFKGKPIGKSVEIKDIAKFIIDGGDNFISIKVLNEATEQETVNLYGTGQQSNIKQEINIQKAKIDEKRVSILKEIGFNLNDLKEKIKVNSVVATITNFGLIVLPFITVILLSDYFREIQNGVVQHSGLPTHMRILLVCASVLLLVNLALKQGVFLFIQNKAATKVSEIQKYSEKGLLWGSILIYTAFFAIVIALLFSHSFKFPVSVFLISFFGMGLSFINAIFSGYQKYLCADLSFSLSKNESREDYKKVLNEYNEWITLFANNMSKTKLQNIKDKLFNLQIKSVGETIIGILTAPFLAYGVSNTLAMCFPEAAGWIRISGLRFSPVFLVLATFLIIFAFFSLVNAFAATRKIQGSEVIKKDGFSNFEHHGTEIYGEEGVKKLSSEKTRSLIIACSIIFIEFSMNVSYFITEIGGDWNGLFLSMIAALVPTALLIAETYILSNTVFEIFAHEELIAKYDRD